MDSAPASQREAAGRRRGSGGIRTALLLALLTAAVGLPTLRHEFVWDDHEQIVDNARLRTPGAFAGFWRQDVLQFSRPGAERSNYYRPLFLLLYFVFYQTFGANPFPWHACAVAVSLAATLAAFLFLSRLGLPAGLASAAALLYSVHPARGESVAWVAAAFNDPPVAILCLLALTAHLSAIRARSPRPLLLAAVAYAGALGFKESALALLLLVPLVEWHAGRLGSPRRAWGALLLRYAPYLMVSVGYFMLRTHVLGAPLGVYAGAPGLLDVLPTVPLLALFYGRLLVWPLGLGPSYPLRYVGGWLDPTALLALAALGGLGLGLLWCGRRSAVARFAILWCAASVLPALNVRSFRATYLVHQRYLYLASLGFCLALAWGIHRLVRGRGSRRAVLAVLAAVFAWSSAYHSRFWATDTALWQRTAAIDGSNPAAFDWLGARAMAAGHLDEAEGLFRRSIRADPASPHGACNLATLLHLRRRRADDALPLYEQALAAFDARPGPATSHEAQCRLNYGAALAQVGRLDQAAAAFEALANRPPYPPEAARNAAVLRAQRGDRDGARRVLEQALQRHPGHPLIAGVLAQLQRLEPVPKRQAPP